MVHLGQCSPQLFSLTENTWAHGETLPSRLKIFWWALCRLVCIVFWNFPAHQRHESFSHFCCFMVCREKPAPSSLASCNYHKTYQPSRWYLECIGVQEIHSKGGQWKQGSPSTETSPDSNQTVKISLLLKHSAVYRQRTWPGKSPDQMSAWSQTQVGGFRQPLRADSMPKQDKAISVLLTIFIFFAILFIYSIWLSYSLIAFVAFSRTWCTVFVRTVSYPCIFNHCNC